VVVRLQPQGARRADGKNATAAAAQGECECVYIISYLGILYYMYMISLTVRAWGNGAVDGRTGERCVSVWWGKM